MKLYIKSFLFILIFLEFSFAGQTGKIAGRVTDASTGESLAGANIILKGYPLGGSTDLDGNYIILNIKPGVYTLIAQIIGYQEMRVTNVQVSIDRTTHLDFKLKPALLEGETITVEAEQPLVQRDLTATEASVSAREIEAIPVESMQDVLSLQAGIVKDAQGEFHVRGGRASEVAYLVDGVSVTDPFSGKLAVNMDQNSIQELKLVSGTFNAEYGQVMSGVVEIVTKDPSDKFRAGITSYYGDYVSAHKDLFYNIDDVNPLSIYNLQTYLSGPVPFTRNKIGFYFSVRRSYNDGWLYGQRRFNPSDSSKFDPNSFYMEQTGDNKPVPMNFSSRNYGNLKLLFRISPVIRLSYNFLGNQFHYRYYNHLYKYNPEGDVSNYEYAFTNILNLNHTLSTTTFYTVKLSYYYFDLKTYLYKDLNDPRYVNPELLRNREDAYSFLTGGTNLFNLHRSTAVWQGKFDITSQINKRHQLKAGFEFKRNSLFIRAREANYKGKKSNIFNADVFLFGGQYRQNPVEGAAYIQDKIELENMTLNIGFRYDYFDSRYKVPIDLRDPSNKLRNSEKAYKPADKKNQFSPRLGIAFPISSRGVIHVSYGYFFQIPPYEYLYADPKFAVAPGGLNTLMGNANLNPQSTVIYEVGIQQQLTDNLGVDITGFNKDVRDLLGTRIYETYTLGDRYARYENRDYGNIRGITISLNKRPSRSDHVIISLDYTYQIAEGNASDPNQSFYNNRADPPKESNIQVVPLNWDQRHTVNLSVSYNNPKIISLGLIGQFQSGLPYTPAVQSMETTFENSGRKPFNYNVDLRMAKEFNFRKYRFTVFMKVYNLFDRKNELNVYSDTGRAGYSVIQRFLGDRAGHVNSLEEWLKRPDFYSEPRRVLIGFSLDIRSGSNGENN
ncbi:MAG: TonB-dependent receptor [Calditrichaeota bacterium]|nr:TonB-dependent receptor [Calditrichota bacterium]